MAAKTATAEAPTTEVKGTTWLAEHVSNETGKDYDGYSIRILLRSLTKEGVIERGEGRYSFSGAKDKTVLAVVKAVKSGAAEKAKQGRLDELKAKREEKADTEAAPKARSRRGKPAVEAEPEAPAKPARSRSRAKKAAEPTPAPADDDLDIDDI